MKYLMKENQRYQFLILLLLFSIFQYCIQYIYVFFLYPDEFGYWSAAATALGWDWREIAGLGSFYSFGYSVILLPILKLVPDSLTAYRTAIAVNMALMYAGFFLLQRISEKIAPCGDKRKHIFFGAVAVLYPAWIFYMQFTAAEATLTFLFVLIAWLFLLFLEKPRIRVGLALAFAMGYIFTVHMRAIGVVIAAGVTIGLWGLCSLGNRKKVLMLIGALLLVFLFAFFLKDIVRERVYSGSGEALLKNNEFSGQLHKIRFMLSAKGIWQLMKNVSGKVLYLGVASMGLLYYGMFWCIGQVRGLIESFKARKTIKGKAFWGIFLMLAVAAEIMIGSIYSIQNTDLDWIIYGRYSEFVLPVLMVLGLNQMYRQRRLGRSGMVVWLIHTILSMLCLTSFVGEKEAAVRGYMSVGLSWLIGQGEVSPGLFFLQAWLLGGALLLLTCLSIYLIKGKKGLVWILGGLLGLEIFSGLQASHMYIYPVNQYMRYELYMGEAIVEAVPAETEVLYLDEGRTQWIDVIQMQLRERPIHVITREELEQRVGENTVLISHQDGQYREELAKHYSHCKEYNVFCLYYN